MCTLLRFRQAREITNQQGMVVACSRMQCHSMMNGVDVRRMSCLSAFLFCRKAVRATVVLFPLLGLTYLLFFYIPTSHRHLYHVTAFVNAALHSLQVSARGE